MVIDAMVFLCRSRKPIRMLCPDSDGLINLKMDSHIQVNQYVQYTKIKSVKFFRFYCHDADCNKLTY